MTLKCKAVLIYWPSLGRFEALFLIQPWQQNFCPPAKSSTTYFSRVYLSCKVTQERVPGAKILVCMGLCRGVTCACACEYQPSFVSAIFHTIQTVLSLTLFFYETVIVYIWPDEGTSCQKLPLPSPPPFPTPRVILSRSGTRKS